MIKKKKKRGRKKNRRRKRKAWDVNAWILGRHFITFILPRLWIWFVLPFFLFSGFSHIFFLPSLLSSTSVISFTTFFLSSFPPFISCVFESSFEILSRNFRSYLVVHWYIVGQCWWIIQRKIESKRSTAYFRWTKTKKKEITSGGIFDRERREEEIDERDVLGSFLFGFV